MGGFTSIGCLLSRLVRVKVNWKVYVMTFFVLPALGIAISLGLGISNKIDLSKIAITAVALMPVNALLGGVVFGIGPLGEEMGWRGFLQDRLQGQGSAVVIAIVVGAIWSVWHAPIAVTFDDFRSGLSLWEFAILYPVFTILLAFILGHFWRWSDGSLFIVIFFHAVSNMTLDMYLLNAGWWDFGDLTPVQVYLIILLVYALVALAAELTSRTILREGSQSDRPQPT
jgi:membrane protease YdiL (CAAX protease family)